VRGPAVDAVSDASAYDRVMSAGVRRGPTRNALGERSLVAQPGPPEPNGEYHFVPGHSPTTACGRAITTAWVEWNVEWRDHFHRCQPCRAVLGEV